MSEVQVNEGRENDSRYAFGREWVYCESCKIGAEDHLGNFDQPHQENYNRRNYDTQKKFLSVKQSLRYPVQTSVFHFNYCLESIDPRECDMGFLADPVKGFYQGYAE